MTPEQTIVAMIAAQAHMQSIIDGLDDKLASYKLAIRQAEQRWLAEHIPALNRIAQLEAMIVHSTAKVGRSS